MGAAAIALNYSVKNIRNDVRCMIYIERENPLFDSLVWGSLTLAPIIYLPYIRCSINANWHSFNPKHCAHRSVWAKYRKQLRKGSTLEPFHFSWLSEAPKSAQEQEDRRWRRSERLRNWGWGTVPNVLLKLLVKDKPLYSGKVRERRETKPPRREKWGCSGWETDR